MAMAAGVVMRDLIFYRVTKLNVIFLWIEAYGMKFA